MTFATVGTLGSAPGKREDLVGHLTQRTDALKEMGCLAYEVRVNEVHPDTVFVVELWTSTEAHRASLHHPEVHALVRV